MKVELYLDRPETIEAFAVFSKVYASVLRAEHDRLDRLAPTGALNLGAAVGGYVPGRDYAGPTEANAAGEEIDGQTEVAGPKAAEAPAKRTRRTKAEIEADKAAVAPPPITQAEPAKQWPAEETAASDDLFGDEGTTEPATRDDLKDAINRAAAALGMPYMQKNLPKLLGYPKFSQIPEDSAAFATAIANLNAAVEGV